MGRKQNPNGDQRGKPIMVPRERMKRRTGGTPYESEGVSPPNSTAVKDARETAGRGIPPAQAPPKHMPEKG